MVKRVLLVSKMATLAESLIRNTHWFEGVLGINQLIVPNDDKTLVAMLLHVLPFVLYSIFIFVILVLLNHLIA